MSIFWLYFPDNHKQYPVRSIENNHIILYAIRRLILASKKCDIEHCKLVEMRALNTCTLFNRVYFHSEYCMRIATVS